MYAMSRLTLYVTKEILKVGAVIFLVSCLIFLAYSSVHFLENAVSKDLPLENLIPLILLKVLIACEVLLPLSLFLSGVLVLSGMHSDREVIALQANGVASARLNVPLLFLALLLGLVTACLSIFVRPWAYEARGALEAKIEKQNWFQSLSQERFHQRGQGNLVFFIGKKISRQTGKTLFVQKKSANSRQIIFAKTVRSKQVENALKMYNGSIYGLQGNYEDKFNVNFAKGVFKLKNTPEQVENKFQTRASSLQKLFKSGSPLNFAEIQWRFLNPLVAIFLALFCLPLSFILPQGRNIKVFLALLLYATYYILQSITESCVEKKVISVFPGSFYALFFLLLIYVFLSVQQNQTIFKKLR